MNSLRCAPLVFLAATLAGNSRGETKAESPPDDAVLGTLDVNGSATSAPLPKLAVMPIVTTNDADTTLQLVVKKDLDLSGQYDVVDDGAAPAGLYLHDSPVDVAAWKGRGLSVLVRVLANKLPGGKVEMLGSAYLLGRGQDPAFQHRLETDDAHVRTTAH
ncbi:MAG TPA: tolB protein, partial [Polyangiaceae bacterium]|nr:tolB protein [Polyangiaceae bacterium]